MAKSLIFIFIFWFALLSSEASYDYFQMVQQWAPATCSGLRTTCPSPIPTIFTIHGLWPSNYSTVRSNCRGSRFNPTQIATLRPQLITYWPDVIKGNNQSFWQHEWDSHGTCSETHFNQFQYFQITLNIRTNQTYDLLAILNAAGLSPTGTTVRQYQAIEGAIQTATGKKPGLRCNTNITTGNKQLHEIILCFDKDGVTLINCTSYAGSNCPNRFVWLSRSQSLIYEIPLAKLFFISITLSIMFVFGKRFYRTIAGVTKRE